jgi:hypothetical protein
MQTQFTLTIGPHSFTLDYTVRQNDGSTVTTSVHGRRFGSKYVVTFGYQADPPVGPYVLTPEVYKEIEKMLNLL